MKRDLLILAAGVVLLAAAAIFNPNGFIFDERLFPPNVELMEKYGFGEQFLVEMKDQAPGPLYEFIHLPLKPITGLAPTPMRIVHLVLFLLIVSALAMYYRKVAQKSSDQAWFLALHLIAIPTLWQVTGIAMTEIPAMLFATLWFWMCSSLLKFENQQSLNRTIGLSLVSGVLLGLAILGRTPYLFLIFASLTVLLFNRYILAQTSVRIIASWLPQTVIALCMIIPVFMIWQGLVPPQQSTVEGAIKPWHCVLAISYAGITGLILNPRWFIIYSVPIKKLLMYAAIFFLVFFLVNTFLLHYSYAPLSNVVSKILPASIFHLYELTASALLATLAAYFLVCCYYRAMENVFNPSFLLALMAMLAILATAAKISHQFSSRYVAQAAPFMIVVFARIDEKDSWKWVRIIIGMIIGFLSLNTYARIF
jgi:hypothetical protein